MTMLQWIMSIYIAKGASQSGVAYIIFTDKTLVEMAQRRNQILMRCLRLMVCNKNMETFGTIFLANQWTVDHMHALRQKLAGAKL